MIAVLSCDFISNKATQGSFPSPHVKALKFPDKRTGGAVKVADSSKSHFVNNLLSKNFGSVIAGAFATSGPVQLWVAGSRLVDNGAGRISDIMGFSEDNRAVYILEHNVLSSPNGTVALLLGILKFLNNSLGCTWKGSIFAFDLSGDFFSASFHVCGQVGVSICSPI